MSTKKTESLADRLFPSRRDEELSESILDIPPEQRRLHTETYDFSVSTLIDYLEKGNIYIPEFQRRYVWNQSQGSRLIESLIIQCPIPVIYLSQDPSEKLAVIDGNQRLKTLHRYIRNHFKLKGLTAYPELEGLHYHELDSRFQRHINNRALRCIVISKDTHPQVKFDVFERLNTGAVRLNSQELRHGLYYGKLMILAAKLGDRQEWLSMLSGGDKRMKGEELIIRFFALHFKLANYRKPLAGFLNEFADEYRDLDDAKADEWSRLFVEVVDGVRHLFGDLAFKIYERNLDPVSDFNAALYDAEMLAVSRVAIGKSPMPINRRKSLLGDLGSLFHDDEFQKSITRATSDAKQINYRINAIAKLVKGYI